MVNLTLLPIYIECYVETIQRLEVFQAYTDVVEFGQSKAILVAPLLCVSYKTQRYYIRIKRRDLAFYKYDVIRACAYHDKL